MNLSAIIPHLISHIIVAIAFFVCGIWYSSDTTPVIPKTITQYIPNYGKYLDLPDFNPASYKYIVVEKEKLNTRIDTVRVPVEIQAVQIIANNGVRVNSKSVFVKYFDAVSKQYVIDKYSVPQKNFTHEISFVALANPIDQFDVFYGGLEAQMYYKRFGLTGKALLSNKGTPLYLVGLTFKLY